jgi:hypothetical protein
MNSHETEIMWFASHAHSARLAAQDCFQLIGSEVIRPLSVVRILGMPFDAELKVKPHIAKVAATSYHLRRLRQILRRVGEDVAVRLVLALITSGLNYCNSYLAGRPQSSVGSLQRV